ncbi:DUF1328 family protein [Haloprofundus halobius]|uniref:DUF1328 family protein n=1 Tax=Haloprofundus halobius TaxID=2876194 RepID=UPI001CCD4769|nr:DUF1328 family protein [Haloprofundus halobius]
MLAELANATAAIPLQSGGFLELAVLFIILAIVSYVVGARGIAGVTMEIARILILVFIVLAILSFLL